MKSSDNFHVMIATPYDIQACPEPLPSNGALSIWDNDHVKMPNSTQNITFKTKLSTWDTLIANALSQTITSFKDLEKVIRQYNINYQNIKFNVLRKLLEGSDTFPDLLETLNWMRELALKLPQIVTTAVPMLRQGKSATLILSRKQVACLLANAFFCTFPRRSSNNEEYKNYSTINFVSLFKSSGSSLDVKIEKLKCVLNYFKQIKDNDNLSGVISFERHCLTQNCYPDWKNSDKYFKNLLTEVTGSIEQEGDVFSEVDFAHKYVGCDVLEECCQREEILFLMSPELIISKLFTEVLADNEALVVTGCTPFNKSAAQGQTFKWTSSRDNCDGVDDWGRVQRQVIMIDALQFKEGHSNIQYNQDLILRELNKAYSGFLDKTNYGLGVKPTIASGKWGCGNFNGDPYLKSLIQLMAASEAERDLILFTFNDGHLKNELDQFFKVIQEKSLKVKDLFNVMEANPFNFKNSSDQYNYLTHISTHL